jgi:hypothetical protein
MNMDTGTVLGHSCIFSTSSFDAASPGVLIYTKFLACKLVIMRSRRAFSDIAAHLDHLGSESNSGCAGSVSFDELAGAFGFQ